MATIFDYINDLQYSSFIDQPLTDLDCLILTELSYLPFDQWVDSSFTPDTPWRLMALATQFFQHYDQQKSTFMRSQERQQLLQAVCQHKRYKNIKVLGFINEVSLAKTQQFAAVCYQIMPGQTVIVYRGTDDSIIGWKEDFHMAYMAEIPAQTAARQYLETALNSFQGQVVLTGHSKGGNLALFASSQVKAEAQARIQKVVAFDAPGLNSEIQESQGFKQLASRRIHYIPQDSIVGMLLQTPDEVEIVHSKAFGLLQHSTFFWEIEDGHFKPAAKLTQDSLQTDQTLKAWLAELSQDEVKRLVDIIFGVILEAGIERFSDINTDTLTKLSTLINQIQQVSEEEQTMVKRLLQRLIDQRIEVFKSNLQLPQLPQFPDFKALYQQLTTGNSTDKNQEN